LDGIRPERVLWVIPVVLVHAAQFWRVWEHIDLLKRLIHPLQINPFMLAQWKLQGQGSSIGIIGLLEVEIASRRRPAVLHLAIL
jgi:hypothetical protein